MAVTDVIARLHGVRSTGRDRWIARCPAHEDRSPSLTIRAVSDGRVLMHCFAGCETQAVLEAIGFTLADLFPDALTRESLPRIHAPFSALDALKCLTSESALVALCASDLAEGKPLSPTDASRVAIAAGRIASALEAVHA